jgi:23S rRNA (cytidine1920-2'-O)/16S rRNA (cytidine1409-2'-O)-methyltransferase
MSADSKRLDLLLLERGLASTRTKAQSLIASGKVSVDGRVIFKSGEKVAPGSRIDLSELEHPYVSRGGLKLAAALDSFSCRVEGLRVLDIGQSTGGFTHCLLMAGAASVVGIEVGSGQLDPQLRSDQRVHCLEKTDIRTVKPEALAPAFPFFVADLSFISLALVLPVLPPLLSPEAEGVVLVKPQFEVGPNRLGSGGIVRDAAARDEAVDKIRAAAQLCGFAVTGVLPSPIAGGDGNLEFLLHLRRSKDKSF